MKHALASDPIDVVATNLKVEYEAHLLSKGIEQPLRQPLGKFLYDRSWVASIRDGASWVKPRKIIDEDGVPNWMFELGVKNLGRRSDYGMAVSVSGNSVTTSFNPIPDVSRIQSANDEEMERISARFRVHRYL